MVMASRTIIAGASKSIGPQPIRRFVRHRSGTPMRTPVLISWFIANLRDWTGRGGRSSHRCATLLHQAELPVGGQGRFPEADLLVASQFIGNGFPLTGRSIKRLL